MAAQESRRRSGLTIGADAGRLDSPAVSSYIERMINGFAPITTTTTPGFRGVFGARD
jgi:hypothetical protein